MLYNYFCALICAFTWFKKFLYQYSTNTMPAALGHDSFIENSHLNILKWNGCFYYKCVPKKVITLQPKIASALFMKQIRVRHSHVSSTFLRSCFHGTKVPAPLCFWWLTESDQICATNCFLSLLNISLTLGLSNGRQKIPLCFIVCYAELSQVWDQSVIQPA